MEKVDVSSSSEKTNSNEIYIINPHGVLIQVKPEDEEDASIRQSTERKSTGRFSSFFISRKKQPTVSSKLSLKTNGVHSNQTAPSTPSPTYSNSSPSSPQLQQHQVLILTQPNNLDNLSSKSTESFFLSRMLSFHSKSSYSKSFSNKSDQRRSDGKSMNNNPIHLVRNSPHVNQVHICVPNVITSSKGRRSYQTMHCTTRSSLE